MKYRRYAEYKDSGVEWLGEVPAHWEDMQLKRELAFVTSGSRGWAENYADEGDIFLRIGNLTRDSVALDLSDIQYVNAPAGPEAERTRVQSGDLLVSITADLGSVAVVPESFPTAYINQHIALARPGNARAISRWLAYQILSIVGKTQLALNAYGGTKIQLSLEDISTLRILVPPLDEQRCIVAFLDRETAQIDALIAKQERLIAVLQEKRQALISHAVTKGLNPDAPMKDSGVEWLGEVPAAWKVIKLGYCLHRIEAGWTPDSLQQLASDDEWAVVKVGCVRDGEFFPDEHKALAPGVPPAPEIEIRAGDLIMSRANTTELVGSIGLVRRTRPRLTLCDKTYRLVLREQLLTTYANYLLQARVARHQIELAASGASPSMKNISQESIRALLLPVPPVAEQERIVCQLDIAMDSHRKISEAVGQTIARLQERRSALISAAVTGKIDVRTAGGRRSH
ncbi:MAG: restriction endonuclease subunit S [Caldilineaceae bacterium]